MIFFVHLSSCIKKKKKIMVSKAPAYFPTEINEAKIFPKIILLISQACNIALHIFFIFLIHSYILSRTTKFHTTWLQYQSLLCIKVTWTKFKLFAWYFISMSIWRKKWQSLSHYNSLFLVSLFLINLYAVDLLWPLCSLILSFTRGGGCCSVFWLAFPWLIIL